MLMVGGSEDCNVAGHGHDSLFLAGTHPGGADDQRRGRVAGGLQMRQGGFRCREIDGDIDSVEHDCRVVDDDKARYRFTRQLAGVFPDRGMAGILAGTGKITVRCIQRGRHDRSAHAACAGSYT